MNVVHVMEEWLASESSQTDNRDAELVRAIQNACQLLGNYSASPDSVMHDQVLGGNYTFNRGRAKVCIQLEVAYGNLKVYR